MKPLSALARATEGQSGPQAHQYKITQSRAIATQISATQEIALPPGHFERKKQQQQAVSFWTLVLMFTLTWITEKELGRRISLEEKHEYFVAAVRK